jgi:hypothetical protein
MERAIRALVRRARGHRCRCRCRYHDSDGWVTDGCPQHASPREAGVARTWAEVAALGCTCRWTGVRAGWLRAEPAPGCPASHGGF